MDFNKLTMKINQTITAIESYHISTHFNREEERTLLHLSTPKTISWLCRETGIEKSSMSRVLNSLLFDKRTIYICKVAPCPISKRTVQWYMKHEKQLKLDL